MTGKFEDQEMTGNVEYGDEGHGGRWRLAAWGIAALLLLLPFVAGAPWTASDYVFAAILLFGSLAAYEVAARNTGNMVYRAGVGLSIAATFLLIWGNAAVSISDSAADAMYFGVAVIGIVGVIIALFRPGAGARTMFAAALTLVVVTGVTLLSGMVPNPYVSVFQLIGITGFYAVLFGAAAWLLWQAAQSISE